MANVNVHNVRPLDPTIRLSASKTSRMKANLTYIQADSRLPALRRPEILPGAELLSTLVLEPCLTKAYFTFLTPSISYLL